MRGGGRADGRKEHKWYFVAEKHFVKVRTVQEEERRGAIE